MSEQSAKSQRYALAAFQALIEKWQAAIAVVSQALSQDQELYATIMNGSRPFDARAEALVKLLPADAPSELANLLKLMLQDGDLDLLSEVSAALVQTASGQRQPVRAEITSATELTDANRQALQQALSQEYGGDLVFQFRVDPSLMGGLRVRVGDRLIDTSVATRLAALRESLTSVVR